MLNQFLESLISVSNRYDQAFVKKARALIYLWIATTFVMWLYVIYTYYAFRGLDQYVLVVGTIATILHSLSPLVLRITQSFTMTGLCISLTGLMFQTTFCLFSGGAHSPSTIWLSFHPVIMGFFGGVPWIGFSVILNSFIILGMTLLGTTNQLPSNVLPPIYHDWMIVTSYLGLDILVGLFTIFAIRLNNDKNRELAESKELTENLVRILCHDINNPLTVVKTSASLIKPDGSDRNHKLIERLKWATQDIQNIIQAVNTWNIHKDGKIILQNESIQVSELIHHISNAFTEKLQQKNIELNIECHIQEDYFSGDKTAVFYQVFNNLLSNAIKFSFQNSVVKLNINQNEQFIEFIIIDSGVGIDPEKCDSVFSPYVQTSSLGTNEEKGTGFGLPIVATIIRKMNGQISIHNRKEFGDTQSGTIVKVKLPKV